VTLRNLRTARALGFLAVVTVSAGILAAQYGGPRQPPVIAFSQSLPVEGGTLQIDFGEGDFDLPRADIVQRIGTAAHAVAVYYGHFPVPRARVLVLPATGRHGVLQGTTWGNRDGFPGYSRLRIGQQTTHDELAEDWVITHELIHTALPDLPDDQHWLEEGIASYVEGIARAQAGQLPVATVWEGMMDGMPNGEPGPGDRGLDVTHNWGRTYWGGALFCLVADVEIRKQTHNRHGLQDALRAIVTAGGSIDKEWPLAQVLSIGDKGTESHVLEQMYAEWSVKPVPVDLPKLWAQLGVSAGKSGPIFDAKAPLAAIRASITAPVTSDRTAENSRVTTN
jgi:hypothetical protein